jgi:protein O-GlcNAc transferase
MASKTPAAGGPDLALACRTRGLQAMAAGRGDEAYRFLSQAATLDPLHADTWFHLADLLCESHPDAAINALDRGLALRIDAPDALVLMSRLLSNKGRHADAAVYAQRGVALRADVAAHYALGLALKESGRIEEALHSLEIAARSADRGMADQSLFLATLCRMEMGLSAQALEGAQELLRRADSPAKASASHEVIAAVLRRAGDAARACTHLEQAVQATPGLLGPRINLCASSPYLHELDGRAQGELARRLLQPWARLAEGATHANTPDPLRRLKVGLLSADFREHSCAYFIEPLLRELDREAVEIHVLSLNRYDDETTQRLRALVADGHWHALSGLGAGALAAQIRGLGIDILVDLAGFTEGQAVEAWATKPAPVQMLWLGYLGSTGLGAMDFRITDWSVDPEGAQDWASEAPLRLPRPYVCYQPASYAPEVGALPMRERGHPTFGSFNTLQKIGDACVELWSDVLQALPSARLLLKAMELSDAGVRERLLGRFARHGIAADRLELVSWSRSKAEHLALYQRVDIALDSFPYNGVTTSCEAMWMGVPVVSLHRDCIASRQGLSLLRAMGLDQLATGSRAGFVARCVDLVSRPDELAALRAGLRERMRASELTDAPGMARAMEQAWRDAWQGWCARR